MVYMDRGRMTNLQSVLLLNQKPGRPPPKRRPPLKRRVPAGADPGKPRSTPAKLHSHFDRKRKGHRRIRIPSEVRIT